MISFDDILIDNDCYSHSHFILSPFFFRMVGLPFTMLPALVKQNLLKCCWHPMLTSTNKMRLVGCYDLNVTNPIGESCVLFMLLSVPPLSSFPLFFFSFFYLLEVVGCNIFDI